jgi:Uma2 family endonuclease
MTPAIATPPEAFTEAAIDHRHLPDTDGLPLTNATEHSQSYLLTSSLRPRLEERSPGGQFAVGEDVGIYWRLTRPVLNGCKSPDWSFVPGVPFMLNGIPRRSYVMWKEKVPPLLLIEYVSGDGSEERDATPNTGKFWVYEQAIGAKYYVIYDSQIPSIEAYVLDGGRYAPIAANAAGRYPIADLGIEFGLHHAKFRDVDLDWLRAWDRATGTMLPDADERTAKAIEQRDAERERADEAAKRADLLAQRLRDLGIDPDA